MNYVVLTGRLVRDIEVTELENEKKVATFTLAVPRPFKNAEGEYETDFINCEIWDVMATNTAEYCKKGDIVGLKGRLQVDSYEKDGKNVNKLKLVGEKVTFLTSNKDKEQEQEAR